MKRLALMLLAAAMLLSVSGCAGIFDREYYTEEAYEAPAAEAEQEEEPADSITNYAALRRAISRLVAEHAESAQLQFQNYDGSIRQDISTACWEVKSSTALGAFAVDYISYDLTRIVSYYQAEIYITYKRSAYQTEALEHMENLAAMSARVDDALRAGETYLVLEMNVAAVSSAAVASAVERAYYGDPLACPVLPQAEVGVYPETGVSHIIEVTLDYGMDSQSLLERRTELTDAVDALVSRTAELGPEAGAADRAHAVFGALAEGCVCDPEAGGTAWDALTQGTASSEGIAMAFEAGCRAAGVDCAVVRGRLDNEPHAWDIVTIDGRACHVDASNAAAGEENVFLVGDESLWGAYWWDTSEYPACPESYGYFAPETEETSGEPSAEEEISGL